MAGRILNRRELRKQGDEAEQTVAAESEPKPVVAKAKRAPGPIGNPGCAQSEKTAGEKGMPRLRARWCVYDGAMKQIAVFDYNQRTEADTKLAEMLGKKKGAYFLQILKDSMPEPVAVEALPEA